MLPRRGMIGGPTEAPPFKPGKYRHYKGGEYEAVCLACDEETHKWLVIYKPLYPHEGMPDMWARVYDVFYGKVVVDGVTLPRFTFLQDTVVD